MATKTEWCASARCHLQFYPNYTLTFFHLHLFMSSRTYTNKGHSASPRNVDKSANEAAPLYARGNSALRSLPNPRSPSSLSVFASVVVSALRNALSVQSTSSTCPPTLRPKSLTDTLPTASSSTDCPRQDLDRYLDWLERTASARVQRSKSSVESSSQTWAGMTIPQTGKRFSNTGVDLNCRTTSPRSSRTI